MVVTLDMPNSRDIEIRDCTDRKISYVIAYDTVTHEIEMALHDGKGLVLCGDEGGVHPVYVKTFLPGSYAVCKTTSKRL